MAILEFKSSHFITEIDCARWLPLHELVPEVPLRHGYSATLANMRGLLSDEEHKRLLSLFSELDFPWMIINSMKRFWIRATHAILRTRDGKLRAAVPSPLGRCVFSNDVSMDDLFAALKTHKAIMKGYPRNGEGLEAFVDASDSGYTVNGQPAEQNRISDGLKKISVLNDDAKTNGVETKGHNGVNGKKINGVRRQQSMGLAQKELTAIKMVRQM